MANISASVVYADDYRIEPNGKILLVGIYGSDVVVESEEQADMPLCSIVRVIAPIMTPILYLDISYLLDNVLIKHIHVDRDIISLKMDDHLREIEVMRSLEEATATVIEDALLFHGASRMMVPISRPISLLSAIVDIGSGPIKAGSVPVIWQKVELVAHKLDSVTAASNLPKPATPDGSAPPP